jgi:hypothetical protein
LAISSNQKARATGPSKRTASDTNKTSQGDKKPLNLKATSKAASNATRGSATGGAAKRKSISDRFFAEIDTNIPAAVEHQPNNSPMNATAMQPKASKMLVSADPTPRPVFSSSTGKGSKSSTPTTAVKSVPGYLRPPQAYRNMAKVEIAAATTSRAREPIQAAKQVARRTAVPKLKSVPAQTPNPNKAAIAMNTPVATPTSQTAEKAALLSIPTPTFNVGSPRRHGCVIPVALPKPYKDTQQGSTPESKDLDTSRIVSVSNHPKIFEEIAALKAAVNGLMTRKPSSNEPATAKAEESVDAIVAKQNKATKDSDTSSKARVPLAPKDPNRSPKIDAPIQKSTPEKTTAIIKNSTETRVKNLINGSEFDKTDVQRKEDAHIEESETLESVARPIEEPTTANDEVAPEINTADPLKEQRASVGETVVGDDITDGFGEVAAIVNAPPAIMMQASEPQPPMPLAASVRAVSEASAATLDEPALDAATTDEVLLVIQDQVNTNNTTKLYGSSPTASVFQVVQPSGAVAHFIKHMFKKKATNVATSSAKVKVAGFDPVPEHEIIKAAETSPTAPPTALPAINVSVPTLPPAEEKVDAVPVIRRRTMSFYTMISPSRT